MRESGSSPRSNRAVQQGKSMTKTVRIENADTSNHQVRVFREMKNDAGEWVREPGAIGLDRPTSMIQETIWREKRLVIEEAD